MNAQVWPSALYVWRSDSSKVILSAGSFEWCPIDWNGKNVDLKVKVNTFLSFLSYIRIFPLTAMHKRVICLQLAVKFNIPSVSD